MSTSLRQNGCAKFSAIWKLFIFGFILANGLANGFGQGFLIHDGDHYHLPRPRIRPEVRSYRIRELIVDASIRSQIASTTVTQVFENTGSVPIEATFVFPLPYDGAVDKMTFLVDGKEIEAKLLPADQARSIYEGYVRRNQDPALLEWIGVGMFRSSVFPIPPGQTRTVTLKYSQLLRLDNRLVDYVFPLSTAKYTSQPLEKFSLRVALDSEEEIKSIFSPTHNIQIDRDDPRHAVVRHSSSNTLPSTDFRLVFDSSTGKIQASVLSYWPADEDQGYFALLASPEVKAADQPVSRKTIIFVVDQSGSMSGQKIEQARQAAKFVLQNLRPDDLFNIIRYETAVEAMAPELQRFTNESRETALGFINSINSGGSTNIDGALKKAMGMVTNSDNPAYVVFLTDGLPTVGETNELAIVANCKAANIFHARLISFGVGYDVNSRLLDRLTNENHGQSEYVRPDEDIESSVAKLYDKISSPVLANMKINFAFPNADASQGEITNRIYPKEVTDLFAKSQLVIIGRYKKSGEAKVHINGQVGKSDVHHEFGVKFAERGASSSFQFVRQLWAARRIGEIIDLIDLHGKNDELVKELIALSIRHGIVTPYTSYLADENASRNQLSRLSDNIEITERELLHLGLESGAQGFSRRVNKQMFKNADNLRPQVAGAGGAGGQAARDAAGGGDFGLEPNQESKGLKKIGNATIYQRGKLLVADNAVDVDVEKDTTIVKVKRYSEEYFQLVKDNSAEENKILSQQREDDEELLIVLRGKTYLIN